MSIGLLSDTGTEIAVRRYKSRCMTGAPAERLAVEERVVYEVIDRQAIERLEFLSRQRLAWADALISPFHSRPAAASVEVRAEQTSDRRASLAA